MEFLVLVIIGLNAAQQKKLYHKIHEVKHQKKQKKEIEIGVIPASEIINNIKKNQKKQIKYLIIIIKIFLKKILISKEISYHEKI